ncbi:unnamed protein product [Caenorhabditis nigoni]
MLDTHEVSMKIHRVEHEFFEDHSQTIETVRRACQTDQERIFNKSMIETSRIIRRTTDFRGNTIPYIYTFASTEKEFNATIKDNFVTKDWTRSHNIPVRLPEMENLR